MSKKGFTLVELLAVLVLLSVIVLVAFPNILGAIQTTDETVSEATKELLKTNARSYVNDNVSVQKMNGCVSVSTLVKENYVKTPIANISKEKSETIEKTWGVTYSCSNGVCKDFKIAETGCQIVK